MANAPKDRKVDLWAKHWNAERDRFEFDRFPNCRWWKADSMGSWKEHWHDLPNGWFPTHWMDAPSGPIDTQSAASGDGRVVICKGDPLWDLVTQPLSDDAIQKIKRLEKMSGG